MGELHNLQLLLCCTGHSELSRRLCSGGAQLCLISPSFLISQPEPVCSFPALSLLFIQEEEGCIHANVLVWIRKALFKSLFHASPLPMVCLHCSYVWSIQTRFLLENFKVADVLQAPAAPVCIQSMGLGQRKSKELSPSHPVVLPILLCHTICQLLSCSPYYGIYCSSRLLSLSASCLSSKLERPNFQHYAHID